MFDPPIFINVRDRVTPLRQLVDWLERAGHQRITLLDNDSTYPPLLEYLSQTPHDVVCLGRNAGTRALWDERLEPQNDWYVYTDPDIVPIEDCPLDLVAKLHALLGRQPYMKAGPGLYLDDVPESFPFMAHERGPLIRGVKVEPGAYASMIDTTFALYRPRARFLYPALRMSYPYEARHVSPAWYGGELTVEDRHYLDHAVANGTYGSSWAAHSRCG